MGGNRRTSGAQERLSRVFGTGGEAVFEREGGPAHSHDGSPTATNRVGRIDAAIHQLNALAIWSDVEAGERGRLNDELGAAKEAAEALKAGIPLPPLRQSDFVAELLIMSDGTRPATLIQHGVIASPAALGSFGDLYAAFLGHIDRSIAATGRLELDGRHVGTGVLVQPNATAPPLILTARHVAKHLERGRTDGLRAHINFTAEFNGAAPDRHPAGSPVLWGGPDPCGDWALIDIQAGDGDLPLAASLDDSEGAFLPPRQLAVVSYPGRPTTAEQTRWDPGIWARLFQGIWHMKRLSPAFVIAGPDRLPLVLHDATTTQGSSGGAMLSVGDGMLGGIHCGAPERDANWGLSLAHIRGRGAW